MKVSTIWLKVIMRKKNVWGIINLSLTCENWPKYGHDMNFKRQTLPSSFRLLHNNKKPCCQKEHRWDKAHMKLSYITGKSCSKISASWIPTIPVSIRKMLSYCFTALLLCTKLEFTTFFYCIFKHFTCFTALRFVH